MTKRLVIGVDSAGVEAAAGTMASFPGLEPESPEASVDGKWRETEKILERMGKLVDRIFEALSVNPEPAGDSRAEKKPSGDIRAWKERCETLWRRLQGWQEEVEKIESRRDRLKTVIDRLEPLAGADIDLPAASAQSFLDLRCGWIDSRLARRISFPAFRMPFTVLSLAARDHRRLVVAAAETGNGFVFDRVLQTMGFSPVCSSAAEDKSPPREILEKSKEELERLDGRLQSIEEKRSDLARQRYRELSEWDRRIEEMRAAARFVRRYAAASNGEYVFTVSVGDDRVEELIDRLEKCPGDVRAVAVSTLEKNAEVKEK